MMCRCGCVLRWEQHPGISVCLPRRSIPSLTPMCCELYLQTHPEPIYWAICHRKPGPPRPLTGLPAPTVTTESPPKAPHRLENKTLVLPRPPTWYSLGYKHKAFSLHPGHTGMTPPSVGAECSCIPLSGAVSWGWAFLPARVISPSRSGSPTCPPSLSPLLPIFLSSRIYPSLQHLLTVSPAGR